MGIVKYHKLSTFTFVGVPRVSIYNSAEISSTSNDNLDLCKKDTEYFSKNPAFRPNTEEPEYREHDTWESFINELKRLEKKTGCKPFSDVKLGEFRLHYILRENENGKEG